MRPAFVYTNEKKNNERYTLIDTVIITLYTIQQNKSSTLNELLYFRVRNEPVRKKKLKIQRFANKSGRDNVNQSRLPDDVS